MLRSFSVDAGMAESLGLGTEKPVSVGHIDGLDEKPLHFAVVDLAALEANSQVEPNEFAIGLGKPGRYVGIFIRNVQACWETVAGQQSGIQVSASCGFLDLCLSQLGKDLYPDRFRSLRHMHVRRSDGWEPNRSWPQGTKVHR